MSVQSRLRRRRLSAGSVGCTPDRSRPTSYGWPADRQLLRLARFVASLERHMARRSLWGAVGGGVGYSIGFPAGTLLSDDRAAAAGMTALPALICLMFGMSLGMALSARRTAAPAPDRARVTTLQPHGLTDYLSRRDLAAEVTLGGNRSVRGGCRLPGTGGRQSRSRPINCTAAACVGTSRGNDGHHRVGGPETTT